ncbi:MAG: metallophosphoesterase [Ilumatobacteraceae bacterium]
MTARPVEVLLLADTHLGPGQGSRLVERLPRSLAAADVILHAGDIVDQSVLDELATFAPVHAVLGNNDHGVVLPERWVGSIGGCEVAMVHDSGPSAGRAGRLRRWFPSADVAVFGHSHIPWHETHVDDRGHLQHHVNPGSATQRRRQPRCTVARMTLRGGQVLDVRRVAVPGNEA